MNTYPNDGSSFKKPIFPLKGTNMAERIRKPPQYENPSDDPSVRKLMIFAIFQEMRALESVQDKNTTPKQDAEMASKMLFQVHQQSPHKW